MSFSAAQSGLGDLFWPKTHNAKSAEGSLRDAFLPDNGNTFTHARLPFFPIEDAVPGARQPRCSQRRPRVRYRACAVSWVSSPSLPGLAWLIFIYSSSREPLPPHLTLYVPRPRHSVLLPCVSARYARGFHVGMFSLREAAQVSYVS